jgi:hypothetical protein
MAMDEGMMITGKKVCSAAHQTAQPGVTIGLEGYYLIVFPRPDQPAKKARRTGRTAGFFAVTSGLSGTL